MTVIITRPRARTTTIDKVDDDEREVLRSLTLHGLGRRGDMRPKFDHHAVIAADNTYVTSIKDDEGTTVAWAMTFNMFSPNDAGGPWTTYFFVHPDYRRQGLATRLYRAVRRRFGIVKVQPWDYASREFFTNVGAV